MLRQVAAELGPMLRKDPVLSDLCCGLHTVLDDPSTQDQSRRLTSVTLRVKYLLAFQ